MPRLPAVAAVPLGLNNHVDVRPTIPRAEIPVRVGHFGETHDRIVVVVVFVRAVAARVCVRQPARWPCPPCFIFFRLPVILVRVALAAAISAIGIAAIIVVSFNVVGSPALAQALVREPYRDGGRGRGKSCIHKDGRHDLLASRAVAACR